MSKITFSQATEGYLLVAGARHLSEHTIRDYVNALTKFSNFLDEDLLIEEITSHHLEAFLTAQTKVPNKTLLSYHVGLSALWTWAVSEHIVPKHIVREVTPPKPEQREIVPSTVVEIRAMVEVVGRNTTSQVNNKHMKDSADRNRAILLLLFDTGMRASDLCRLNFSHVDSHNRRVRVRGKGAKERTGQTLWRYLTSRQDVRANDSLIATVDGHRVKSSRLQKILGKIGNRGGISKVHPHRFRHTFGRSFGRLVNAQ